MFRKFFAAAVLCLCTCCSALAAEVDMHDPYRMLITVADQTFTEIKQNSARVKSDAAYRRELVRTHLMPYVDTAYAAYKVIGNNLKNTTREERDAFAAAFGEYIASTYAEALGKYDQQELVSPPYQQVGADESNVSIKFLIRESGKQDLELVFKLRKNKNTGEWRAWDMVAENISMLTAKQSELGPMIREQGVAAVTALLVRHNSGSHAGSALSEDE